MKFLPIFLCLMVSIQLSSSQKSKPTSRKQKQTTKSVVANGTPVPTLQQTTNGATSPGSPKRTPDTSLSPQLVDTVLSLTNMQSSTLSSSTPASVITLNSSAESLLSSSAPLTQESRMNGLPSAASMTAGSEENDDDSIVDDIDCTPTTNSSWNLFKLLQTGLGAAEHSIRAKFQSDSSYLLWLKENEEALKRLSPAEQVSLEARSIEYNTNQLNHGEGPAFELRLQKLEQIVKVAPTIDQKVTAEALKSLRRIQHSLARVITLLEPKSSSDHKKDEDGKKS